MTIYTIPEFEQYYHQWKRTQMQPRFHDTLPIERFNLNKKKVVKKRKTELTTNHLDLPVNNILQHKETKDAFNTNKFTDLIIAYLKSVHNCNSARRISSEGRYRPGVGFLKGTHTGMEDIQALIKGKLFAIEVKSPTDRMSDEQKKRKAAVESDGGHYIIATSFEQVQSDLLSILK
tara:strand:- start:281 stop:808 length:528 start_codon:yes stop_codon:yes gene_type:complete